jgi:exodeoxyribonuclease V beta subunit
MTRPFDITAAPLPNGTLIEASAGTGKTHAVAAYVTKALATDESLRIAEILVTTYTRNAAAELRERIRSRLVVTARLLRGQDPPAGYRQDDLDAHLLADEPARADMARRLERAAAEFDTATIGTIHAISARVLRLAGVEASETADEEFRDRVLDEVVNDAVVTEAIAGRQWDETELRDLVKIRLSDPFIEMTWDSARCSPDQQSLLERAPALIDACVARARQRMRARPSFDELLVRAWQEVTIDPADPPAERTRKEAFVVSLREKFKLAIVDEAQDTNRLQWEFFHAIFPPSGNNRLIAVGDPKQAIYRFRGADVAAYVHHAQDGVPAEPDPSGTPTAPKRTLSVNRRSDGPLLAGLNAVMAGATFGTDIPYREVSAAPGREAAQIAGLRPVEFLDVRGTTLVDAAVRKVYELLSGPHFKAADTRPFRPREVCVLVRTNAVGAAVARRLLALQIPAVTEGTASVMDGQMAADLRSLLEAMERPSHSGRARRAAATPFFGEPLETVAHLTESREQEIQAGIASLHATLQRHGIAAMAAAILADAAMLRRIAIGDGGDRRIVDLSHLVELLNDASRGRGCHAREMLEHVAALASQDKKADLLSRRVESDSEAVTIMTVHAAKGLQFPCVVIVDGWTPPRSAKQPEIFHRGGTRLLDIGKVIPAGELDASSKDAARGAEHEEMRRLVYVAMTRPEHHVCILRTSTWDKSLLRDVLVNAPASAADVAPAQADTIAVRTTDDLPAPRPWGRPVAGKPIAVAPAPQAVIKTYRRTSYSGITKAASRLASTGHEPEGRGHDEEMGTATAASTADEEPAIPTPEAAATRGGGQPGLDGYTIAAVPAGTAFGSIVHEIFEALELGPDLAAADVRSRVEQVVSTLATARFLEPHRDDVAAMITDAVLTPFGGPVDAAFRDLRFADFAPQDRLAEMDFEMSLATLSAGVRARHVGEVLRTFLDAPSHPLAGYADRLAGAAFDVPLAGLLNGSIDAVLRMPGSTTDSPRLLIADYKTNRLHDRDAASPLTAYAPARLVAAMEDHHYPLQALVYGTAVWRMLRWRLGSRKPAGWDPSECLVGAVYGFIRGMKGPTTPSDEAGGRYGVFTWQPPPGIWRRLSDLFAGDLTGVTP